MSMMWSSMPSFSWSLGIPRSLFSHWAPEQPLLHRHLLGSIHTPPLRQAGSHLATATEREREKRRKQSGQKSTKKRWQETQAGILFHSEFKSQKIKQVFDDLKEKLWQAFCCMCITTPHLHIWRGKTHGWVIMTLPRKQQMQIYEKGTHQLGRRVPPSRGCSSTCQQECSVRSYSVWNKLSSAALEAPPDAGTPLGHEACNSCQKEGKSIL